jgi:hypothetical protein
MLSPSESHVVLSLSLIQISANTSPFLKTKPIPRHPVLKSIQHSIPCPALFFKLKIFVYIFICFVALGIKPTACAC